MWKDVSWGCALPVVHSLGPMIFDPVWGEKSHSTTSSELIHVIRGRVTLECGRRRHAAGPGDTLVIPAGTVHRDRFDPEEGLQVFMVFFSWEPPDGPLSRLDNRRLLSMSKRGKSELARLFRRLRTDRGAATAADELVARARVATILALVLRECLGPRRREGGPETDARRARRRRLLVEKAKAYLDQRFQEGVSLDEVAKALQVSPYYLSHVFSEESDFSLFSYLTSLRMAKAEELLTEGLLNVSEVAYAVGYESPNYFSKVFRARFGIAPRDFAARAAESASLARLSAVPGAAQAGDARTGPPKGARKRSRR